MMKKLVTVLLLASSASTFAAGTPIGTYVAAAQSANQLPDTNLQHHYLPITGTTLTLNGTYSKQSSKSVTTSSSGSVNDSFSVNVVNENDSLVSEPVYVAVLGSTSGTSLSQMACSVASGTKTYNQCLSENPGLQTPVGIPYNLYISPQSFQTTTNFQTTYNNCSINNPVVVQNTKNNDYTITANTAVTVTINTHGTCVIS